MLFLFGYYVLGLFVLVYGGRVRTLREFLAAFLWAPIWPMVLMAGWKNV
jgi:hypothetical protein